MSKREIEAALREKGLNPKRVEFYRPLPFPGSAETAGWTVRLDASSEKLLESQGEDSEVPQFRNTVDALAWIDGLPDCRSLAAA